MSGKIRTWHIELAFVALVLAVVALLGPGGVAEWVGAAAVTLTFAHAQVADRLAERDAIRIKPSVTCHRRAVQYLVGKEALWFVYFVLHHSWAALAGVNLFLIYPLWRKWWRKRHPIKPDHVIEIASPSASHRNYQASLKT